MNQKSIIVIGAGMAGLTAAKCLQEAGHQVTVIEKEAQVGGRVKTAVVNNIHFDTGAQFMAKFYTQTRALIAQAGLYEKELPIEGYAAVKRGKQLHQFWPAVHAITTQVIGWWSKLKLGLSLLTVLPHWAKIDVEALGKLESLDTQSVSDYARQSLNKEILEYVLQPPLRGIFYWTPERTSQAMLFLIYKLGASMSTFALRDGLGELPANLAKNLTVKVDTRVSNVRQLENSQYEIQIESAGNTDTIQVDAVVCATPAPAVTRIFTDLNQNQRDFFEAIAYGCGINLTIGTTEQMPSQFYGVYLPRQEQFSYLDAVVVQSGKGEAHQLAKGDLVGLFSANHTLLDLSDNEIYELLLTDLRSALPANFDPTAQQSFFQIHRWPHAVPEFNVGHFKRLKTFAQGEVEFDRVVFCGDYLGGPYIEGAVMSGNTAAKRLLNQL